jgi:hypothetical protein
MSSPPDPFLILSKRCLLTMPQVQILSPVIAGLSPAPSSQTMNGVNVCLFSGSFAAGSSPTQFLSISILANTTWTGLSRHVSTLAGFYNGKVESFHQGGSTQVKAGAQIMSGKDHGRWLVLDVASTGSKPLATLPGIELALSQAETQYLHPNTGATQAGLSSPSATTGGNTSGNPSASKNVACQLMTTSDANQFAPPDANPPLHAVVTGSGSHQFTAGTTDYVCGFAFWTGGAVNQGMEDGWVMLDIACGPAAASTVLGDEVNTSTFDIGGTTAAIGLTRYRGSVGTGNPQAVLGNAERVAQRINACG